MNLAASTIALAIIASGASAQQFNGAEITVNYGLNTDANHDFAYSHGSAEFGFGRFAVQADVGVFGWNAFKWNFQTPKTSATIHGIYNVSDRFAVGAFVGNENWPRFFPTDWLNLGVEARYTFGDIPVEIEGFYLNQSIAADPGLPYEFLSLSTQYSVSENLDLNGGYIYYHGISTSTHKVILAAQYNLANGISIGGEYAQIVGGSASVSSASIFTFNISKNFGHGVTFGARDWSIATRGI